MSITQLISWVAKHRPAKQGESLSYEAVFKGSPADQGKTDSSCFMPGLRAIEHDLDAYFKDVFAGPVF